MPILALLTAAPAIVLTAERYDRRVVCFDRPDGAYTASMMAADFGNAAPPPGRDLASIVDGAMRVRFPKGHKVAGTGLSANLHLPPRAAYTLSYRIRFPLDFEAGLHGKQIGLGGGAGYDGGRGQQARDHGDGWSARLQFDARAGDVTNQLYVYHAAMTGTYGDALGTAALKFALTRGTWHTIRMRVAMQTAADRADGRIQVWCDDALKFDVAGIRFVTRESGRAIDRLRLELFPGGGGAVPSRDAHVDVDDVAWSAGTD